jgi:nicotinamide phosphoribosyltransferase
LVNFKGSDTLSALIVANKIYKEKQAAFSIPAAEHSTITAWGREFEYEAYQNMVRQFGNGGSGLYAVVSDSYNIFEAVKEIWGRQLKDQVLKASNLLVVRPDSGTPHEVVRQVVEDLDLNFGHYFNDKGYKVLKHVRVIQGDGITLEEIQRILDTLEVRGWSADNIAFGMGGALLQRMDRDTQKFAIKASNATIKGREVDFRKEPITDNGKRSKMGKQKLVLNDDARLSTVPMNEIGHDILRVVYENGTIYADDTLADIRNRARI